MRCLLTGSSGFLGQVILKSMLKNNWDVRTIGRNEYSNFRVDLTKLIDVDLGKNYETIIHCAGKAHVIPKNKEEEDDFFNVNVGGTKNLLEAISSSRCYPKLFILISTVAVYGKASGTSITEAEQLCATDPYGRSKIEAEDLVLRWCTENAVSVSILRLPLVVGDMAPGNLGAMIKGIGRGTYFNISGGRARKSMILAEDVADIIASGNLKAGIFNLTDGQHPTFAQLSNQISQYLCRKSPKNIPFWVAKSFALIGDLVGSKFPVNSKLLLKITSDLTFSDYKAVNELNWKPRSVIGFFKTKR